MPMTERKKLAERSGSDPGPVEILRDERLAAAISAYLDGELAGEDLVEFEALLKRDALLAHDVRDLRNIQSRLAEMGADILAEPLPEGMLKTLGKLNCGDK